MVNGKIICLCTRLEENLLSCKISSLVLLRLLSYEEEEEEESDIYLHFIPHVFNFLHAVTFLHVLHLDVLRGQIEIDKN